MSTLDYSSEKIIELVLYFDTTTEKYLRYFASCNLRMLASLVQFKLEDSDMDVSWVEDDPLIYQLLAVLPTNPEVPLQHTILAEKRFKKIIILNCNELLHIITRWGQIRNAAEQFS